MADSETFVDQHLAASAEAKQLLSDLRYERKQIAKDRAELLALMETAKTVIHDAIEADISEHVRVGLDAYKDQVRQAQEAAVDAVFRRFDEIYNTLVAGTKTGTAPGGIDLRRAAPSFTDRSGKPVPIRKSRPRG